MEKKSFLAGIAASALVVGGGFAGMAAVNAQQVAGEGPGEAVVSESVNVPAGDYAAEVVEAEAVPSPEPTPEPEPVEVVPVEEAPAPAPAPVEQAPAPAPKPAPVEPAPAPSLPPTTVEVGPTGAGNYDMAGNAGSDE